MFHNLFRKKCDAKSASSFAEYIQVLKLFQNVGGADHHLLRTTLTAYFVFPKEKPEFFKTNLHQLFAVDDLHQQLYEKYGAKMVKLDEDNVNPR